jgi:hypothetical protein
VANGLERVRGLSLWPCSLRKAAAAQAASSLLG